MRILVVMPHYYKYNPDGRYGSESRRPEKKIESM